MNEESKTSIERERSLFVRALRLSNPNDRAAFLERECSGQPELRANVESLLQNHKDDSFMANPDETVRLSAVTEKPGDMIGRYKLMEKIGEGGFGVVYVAEQREPVRRRVALKISKLGMDTHQVVARFEAERQALALMDHPNIAKVLDGGATPSGRPYFVMELVKGMKVTEFCDQSKLTTRQRLDLFIQICRAVQHAHQKGVIHRDIKPSNILVTLHDGVPVPKVIDFGIAKATQGSLTDKTIYTEFQQFLGTPAYMSPEQAEMSGLDIDTRSDLYSLGVLLYELLTGGPPFDGQELLAAGPDEMRRTIREQEPPRPSARLGKLTNDQLTTTARRHGTEPPKLMHLVQGDLDWIVMRCLEKDRARRYESASGLATDIERHLGNEPIVARPPSNLYRFQKMVRRHRVAFGAAAAICVSLILGIAGSLMEAARATRYATLESTQRKRADKSLETASILFAYHLIDHNELNKGIVYLANVIRLNPSNNAALSQLALLLTYDCAFTANPSVMADASTDAQLTFSSDGEHIFTSRRFINTNCTARIWNAQTGQPIGMRIAGNEQQWECSSYGKRVLTVSTNEICQLRDYESGKSLGPPIKNAGSHGILFSPDGKRLLVNLNDESALVLDAQTGLPLGQPIRGAEVPWPAFSPDGERILTFSSNGICRVWDAQTSRPLSTSITNVNSAEAQFSSDGSRFLVMSSEGSTNFSRVWDTHSGRPLSPPLIETYSGTWPRLSPDGKVVLTASSSLMRIEDVQTVKAFAPLTNMDSPANSGDFEFSPDGRKILFVSNKGNAVVWDAKTGQCVLNVAAPRLPDYDTTGNFPPYSVGFSSDSRLFAVVIFTNEINEIGWEHNINWHSTVWDVTSGRIESDIDGNAGRNEFLGADQRPISHDHQNRPRSVLVTSNDWPTVACELYPKNGPCPEWVLKLIEAASGLILNDQGLLEETKLNREQIVDDIREKLKDETGNDDWVVWGRWLLADPSTRVITPFFKRNLDASVAMNTPHRPR